MKLISSTATGIGRIAAFILIEACCMSGMCTSDCFWVTQNCHASWIQWRNCCSISCTCTYMYELRYIDIISVCFDELILTLIVECFRTRPLKKVEENRIYYIYLFKFFFKYIPYLQQMSHVVQYFFLGVGWGECNGVLHVLKCLLWVWNATRMHTFVTTTSIFELDYRQT